MGACQHEEFLTVMGIHEHASGKTDIVRVAMGIGRCAEIRWCVICGAVLRVRQEDVRRKDIAAGEWLLPFNEGARL